MPVEFADLIKIAGIVILFTLSWAASVAYVYWDCHRRDPRGMQVYGWTALAAVLPLVGTVFYISYRFVASLLYNKDTASPSEPKRETALKRLPEQVVHLPTILASSQDLETITGTEIEPTRSPVRQEDDGKWVLAISSGADQGMEFLLDSLPVRIGRNADCAIRLVNDLGVSRTHAEIYLQDGEFWIRDLDSTHGTQVNGTFIAEHHLKPGDIIRAGQTDLQVRLVESAER